MLYRLKARGGKWQAQYKDEDANTPWRNIPKSHPATWDTAYHHCIQYDGSVARVFHNYIGTVNEVTK